MKNPAKAAGERLPRPDLAERVVLLTGGIVSEDLFQFLTGSGRPFIASRSSPAVRSRAGPTESQSIMERSA